MTDRVDIYSDGDVDCRANYYLLLMYSCQRVVDSLLMLLTNGNDNILLVKWLIFDFTTCRYNCILLSKIQVRQEKVRARL